MHPLNFSAGISVKYRTEIIDAATGVVESVKESKNLWLDSGFERMGQNSHRLDRLLKYVALGTGTLPTRRDSGTITASQAGNVVTASAAFFDASDVGRLLKFDSGAEVYITAFSSATSVTVGDSVARGASEFTVWYVNATAHEAEFLRVGDYTDVSAALVGDTYTLTRTFTSAAFATGKLIQEIGWSDQAGAGALVGRDRVPGGGDYVAAGKQYRVTVSFSIKYGPTVAMTHPDVGNNGFSTAGQYALEAIGHMPDGGLVYVGLSTSSAALAPLAGSANPVGVIASKEATKVAYVPGSRRLKWSAKFTINEGNSTAIRSIIYGFDNGYALANTVRLLLDAPQTKDALHTLQIDVCVNLTRTLTN